MKYNIHLMFTAFIIGCLALITGCAGQQTRATSSVVDYLYPKGMNDVIQPSTPMLNLPLKVGVAFVPEQRTRRIGTSWSGAGAPMLTEAKKLDLLDDLSDHFRSLEFVDHIEVIPSAYLKEKGGFTNLDQIQTMYGVDVIALVSYDQVQFTDADALSLSYWTIVGAYVVSGEKNDTSTMLDTVVYDIKSRKMLFRAPGVSAVQGTATPVNLSAALREDSLKGFTLAADDMKNNLDLQLKRFKDKVKDNPEQVQVVHREGYAGGVFSLEMIILSLLAFGSVLVRRRSS
jgi:rhombotail lipoprotein